MPEDKHCPRCGEDWPADTAFFYKHAGSRDGLFYCCIACALDIKNRSARGASPRSMSASTWRAQASACDLVPKV